MSVYKYKFYSAWPTGEYWEAFIDVPVYVGWSPTLSDMVAPAREFFPEAARDVPLAQLSFVRVREEEVTETVPKMAVYNVTTGVKWFETNVPPERIDFIAKSSYLTAAFPQPVRKGILTVKTEPVAGDIFVDDSLVGKGSDSSEYPVGTHHVSFGDVEGYITPNPVDAVVEEGKETVVTGTYTKVVCYKNPGLRRLYLIAEKHGWKRAMKNIERLCDRLSPRTSIKTRLIEKVPTKTRASIEA